MCLWRGRGVEGKGRCTYTYMCGGEVCVRGGKGVHVYSGTPLNERPSIVDTHDITNNSENADHSP